MNLDKLHSIVKRLDSLLTDRETGLSVWWVILGETLAELKELLVNNGSE